MEDGNKITIVAKDGKVDATILTGKSFVVLKDRTTQTFTADNIPSFVKYVNEAIPLEGNPVFASSGMCVVLNQNKFSKESKPIAKVEYKESSVVSAVKSLISIDNIHIEKLETLMKPLLAYGDTDMVKLYQFTRNCNIQSVSEIKRELDDDGNYAMVVSRTNKNDQRIRPVESFIMDIPIIEMHDETAKFKFDVTLSYKDGQTVQVFVSITNFTFIENVKRASIALVNKYLEKITQERHIYNGLPSINKEDDGWMYSVI